MLFCDQRIACGCLAPTEGAGQSLSFESQYTGPALLVAVIALNANLSSCLVARGTAEDAAKLIAHRVRDEAITEIHCGMNALPKQDVTLLETREISHPLEPKLGELLTHVAGIIGGPGIQTGMTQSCDNERRAIVVSELTPAVFALGITVGIVVGDLDHEIDDCVNYLRTIEDDTIVVRIDEPSVNNQAPAKYVALGATVVVAASNREEARLGTEIARLPRDSFDPVALKALPIGIGENPSLSPGHHAVVVRREHIRTPTSIPAQDVTLAALAKV